MSASNNLFPWRFCSSVRKIIDRLMEVTGKTQQDIGLQVFDKTIQVFSKQIKTNNLDFGKLIEWAIAENIDMNWLLIGKGTNSESCHTVGEKSPTDNSKIDVDLLISISRIVEKSLLCAGLALEPGDKAEAMALLYELYCETGKNVEEGTVKRYLKLVA